MSTNIQELRLQAQKMGLNIIQESPNKWLCIRKADGCFLARERTEYLAIVTGKARAGIL